MQRATKDTVEQCLSLFCNVLDAEMKDIVIHQNPGKPYHLYRCPDCAQQGRRAFLVVHTSGCEIGAQLALIRRAIDLVSAEPTDEETATIGGGDGLVEDAIPFAAE